MVRGSTPVVASMSFGLTLISICHLPPRFSKWVPCGKLFPECFLGLRAVGLKLRWVMIILCRRHEPPSERTLAVGPRVAYLQAYTCFLSSQVTQTIKQIYKLIHASILGGIGPLCIQTWKVVLLTLIYPSR